MKKIKGFTLIEIVIVIAILGILAGTAIPRFTDANEAARGAKLLGDMRTIESMALVFAANNGGKYPKVSTTTKVIRLLLAPKNLITILPVVIHCHPKAFL